MSGCGNVPHRGLRRLDRGDPSNVRADQARRIADVLGHLDKAIRPSDLDLPGYRLHPLKGDLKGMWSVTISGNWRIAFRFVDGNALDAYYLPNQADIDAYLIRQNEKWAEGRRNAEPLPADLRERLMRARDEIHTARRP